MRNQHDEDATKIFFYFDFSSKNVNEVYDVENNSFCFVYFYSIQFCKKKMI
jgi:hypothetical protein